MIKNINMWINCFAWHLFYYCFSKSNIRKGLKGNHWMIYKYCISFVPLLNLHFLFFCAGCWQNTTQVNPECVDSGTSFGLFSSRNVWTWLKFDQNTCWAIFRIARPMALQTLAGRREYVGTWRSYDRTISARLKDARMRCTAEMHVWVHKRGKNVKEPGRCTY